MVQRLAQKAAERMSRWYGCQHVWHLNPGTSHLSDERREEVRCMKCDCPGERWVATGEVDWPTT